MQCTAFRIDFCRVVAKVLLVQSIQTVQLCHCGHLDCCFNEERKRMSEELRGRLDELEMTIAIVSKIHEGLTNPIAMSTLDLVNEQLHRRSLYLINKKETQNEHQRD